MKHWGKSVIQEQQINILKTYILKYTGFFYCFRPELGACSSLTSLLVLKFLSLPYLNSKTQSRFAVCRDSFNGLPHSWRWFLLTLESCPLWAFSPLLYRYFCFRTLKSEALLLFEWKSGYFLSTVAFLKTQSSDDLELKVAHFPKCVSIYRNHYFSGIQRNVFQVRRKWKLKKINLQHVTMRTALYKVILSLVSLL